MDGYDTVLHGAAFGGAAEIRGGDEDGDLGLEVHLRAKEVADLPIRDLPLRAVALALDHHGAAVGQTSAYVGAVVTRAADAADFRTSVPPAEVGHEVLELRAVHQVHFGKRSMADVDRVFVTPLPVTAPDETVLPPQPPSATADSPEQQQSDQVWPDGRPERQEQRQDDDSRPMRPP